MDNFFANFGASLQINFRKDFLKFLNQFARFTKIIINKFSQVFNPNLQDLIVKNLVKKTENSSTLKFLNFF